MRKALPASSVPSFGDWTRQLEAAGSAAPALWFQKAKMNFNISYGLNLINTFDATAILTANDLEVEKFDGAARAAGTPPVSLGMETLPVVKLSNNTVPTTAAIAKNFLASAVVNEVQIELGEEKPYTAKLADASVTGDDRAHIQELWNIMRSSLGDIVKIREKTVMSILAKPAYASICDKWAWAPREAAKGETGLKLLSDASRAPASIKSKPAKNSAPKKQRN